MAVSKARNTSLDDERLKISGAALYSGRPPARLVTSLPGWHFFDGGDVFRGVQGERGPAVKGLSGRKFHERISDLPLIWLSTSPAWRPVLPRTGADCVPLPSFEPFVPAISSQAPQCVDTKPYKLNPHLETSPFLLLFAGWS